MADSFDPTNVDLTSADPAQVVCFLTASENDYDGRLGVRISAVFVILILSTAATLFPVMAVRVPSIKVPLYALLFARYFGAGVIIATAFIHLLDPAYEEIGPASCVGCMLLSPFPPAALPAIRRSPNRGTRGESILSDA